MAVAWSRSMVLVLGSALLACSSKTVHEVDSYPGSGGSIGGHGPTAATSAGGSAGADDSGTDGVAESSSASGGGGHDNASTSAMSAGGANDETVDSVTSTTNTGTGGATTGSSVGGASASLTSGGDGGTGGNGGTTSSVGGTSSTGGTGGTSSSSGGTDSATSTTSPTAVCPNGEVEDDEECDDGEATVTCSLDCTSCVAPSPVTVVDQELGFCTSSCLEGWVGNGQTVAQQFRVAQTGRLSSVELYVMNYAAGTNDITLELVDAGTIENLLAGATPSEIESYVVATSTIEGSSSAFAWERFDFSSEDVVLDPNNYYFLWLRMLPPYPSDTSTNIRWNLWNDSSVEDPYPTGRAYFCPPESACQLEPQPFFDYAFRIRLTPPPPLCE